MAVTQNTYTGNGSTVLFSFTFPYLETTDIKVSVNGTTTTAYTLANATTIQFNTAPANGAAIRIYRETDDTGVASTFFAGSAIRAQDLNSNFTQNLYVTQESNREATTAVSTANSALTNSNTAISTANSAVSTANSAVSTANSAVSTANTASTNASAAVSTANTASSNASTAVSTANAASATAASAVTTANNAVSTANGAVSTANAANSTANSALTAANSAVSTANTANTNASNAVSTANTANTNASTAVSTANTASTNASTAVSTANTANTKADQAIAAVSNSINFQLKANVAAIPASPANDTYIEVQDSTGLESFTPLAGKPAGFVGDAGLSVRLRYTTAGTTWNWLNYYANDSDARFLKKTGGTMTGKITLDGNPSANLHPATKQYVDAADATLTSAAAAAQSTANTAVSNAAAAQSTANTAVTNAAAAQATADAALPKAGGTATGNISAPAFIPTGGTAPTNGVYLNGANSVAISSNGAGRLFVNSSGLVGIGTSSPAGLLHLSSTFGTTLTTGLRIDGAGSTTNNVAPISFYTQSSNWGTQHAANVACGNLSGTDGGGYLRFSTAPDGNTAPAERLRITAAGLVGIGTTSPVDALHVLSSGGNTRIDTSTNAGTASLLFDVPASNGLRASGHRARISCQHEGAGWDSSLVFYAGNTATSPSEAMRIDASRRLLVGTSTARTNFFNTTQSANIQLEGAIGTSLMSLVSNADSAGGNAALILGKTRGTTVGSTTVVQSGDVLGRITFQGSDGTEFVQAADIYAEVDGTPGANDMPGRLVFSTTADGASSPTERMRITNDGHVLIGHTSASDFSSPGINILGPGAGANDGLIEVVTGSSWGLTINRVTDDGVLTYFAQAGTIEGSISVSGTTVSYNGAHLSRYSQLPSGTEREEILRGTVLSNIDEMCEWGEEDNEQLNRMKVSDVEGDKNVSGVFQAWDDDDDTYTNDFYCAMTGDFIIRIAAGVTVERGDLLMSAGDGTAKPQDDDIIRSKTIAKVTSTNVSCTYEDGSYCVPCVLMAC